MTENFIRACLSLVIVCGSATTYGHAQGTTGIASAAGDDVIAERLEEIRAEFDLPALAGAIVTSEGIAAAEAVGIRKRGTETSVTIDDKWHIGSDTKAMTAAQVARLVEQQKLDWDTALAEVFPKLRDKMHPDFRDVTVLHLLSHRAGLPANLDLARYLGKDAPKERRRAVEEELAKKPQSAPGSKFEYSNLGYIIAGAAVEKITGKSWEDHITALLFDPLEMKRVGFGGTGTPGKIDQPWGHTADGKPVGGNGPAVDNPPVMGPAGRVHCTLEDWGAFIADYLRGRAGEPALLERPSYEKLSTPPFGGEYALGWIVTNRDWGGGEVLTHSGSNTMNFATVWIAPKRDFAVLACTNQGGESAARACDAAASALIQYQPALASRLRDRRSEATSLADEKPEGEAKSEDPLATEPLRTWTSHVGSTVQARLVEISEKGVVLERQNGKRIALRLDQLSRADQTYVARRSP